jgi:hypothetical protein
MNCYDVKSRTTAATRFWDVNCTQALACACQSNKFRVTGGRNAFTRPRQETAVLLLHLLRLQKKILRIRFQTFQDARMLSKY